MSFIVRFSGSTDDGDRKFTPSRFNGPKIGGRVEGRQSGLDRAMRPSGRDRSTHRCQIWVNPNMERHGCFTTTGGLYDAILGYTSVAICAFGASCSGNDDDGGVALAVVNSCLRVAGVMMVAVATVTQCSD